MRIVAVRLSKLLSALLIINARMREVASELDEIFPIKLKKKGSLDQF